MFVLLAIRNDSHVCLTFYGHRTPAKWLYISCFVLSPPSTEHLSIFDRNITHNFILFCAIFNRNAIKYNHQNTDICGNTPITIWIQSANHLVGWVSNPSSTNQKPSTHPAPTDSCQKQLSQRYILHILVRITKRRIHAMLVHCSGCAGEETTHTSSNQYSIQHGYASLRCNTCSTRVFQ